MALLEDLIERIDDPELRARISSEVSDLKGVTQFGLVFEGHEPETVTVHSTVRPGRRVTVRTEPDDRTQYTVEAVAGGEAVIRPDSSDETLTVPVENLLVVRSLGEPIYPGLRPVGSVRRSDDRPTHAVMNGENFHALHALSKTHAGKVDVIYLDPPYNTGDKSWKYNNRFVDGNDGYRHSKWLSFMEKRLKLAKALLKPDGVLIVTIDEHEVHNLGVLLRDLFKDAYHQMVTIVNNPKGVTQPRFSRVEEYALFCFFGDAAVSSGTDDLLTWGGDEQTSAGTAPRWKGLLRSGTNALPSDRPNMVYPIGIEPETGRVVGIGRSLKDLHEEGLLEESEYDEYEPDPSLRIDGQPAAWPIRKDGSLGNWGLGRSKLMSLVAKGMVSVGGFDEKRSTWALSYLSSKLEKQVDVGVLDVVSVDPKTGTLDVRYRQEKDRRLRTVWHRSSHDAGVGGSDLLSNLLGVRAFDFPKSLYAVADTLASVVSDRPEAVIVDVFAGSGTTLHAVALLNAQDGGTRRCILVTNNDLSDSDAKSMHKQGKYSGDPDYEALGIFESVTKPRVEAAVTGERPDGSAVPGSYLDQYLEGYEHQKGFEENVEFFDLEYLEPDLVELGYCYERIAPLLWLEAGAVGRWEERKSDDPWSAPSDSTYAVLFDPRRIADFVELVEAREEITHVWVDSSSRSVVREVRMALPDRLVHVGGLYGDYLREVVARPKAALA